MPQDIAQMKSLGLQPSRFSVAWPGVMPNSRGAVDAAGLSFDDHLVDPLLAAGIVPMATLNHWDLPQAVQEAGGWVSRASADCFADYAARFVSGWATG
jgi:beta-glucosidase